MSTKTPKINTSVGQSSNAFNQGGGSNPIGSYGLDLSGFGQSNSNLNNNNITTTTSLNPDMQSAYNTASAGQNTSLQALNTPYDQQLQQLDAGNNAGYNYQKAQNDLQFQNSQNSLQSRMAQSGLTDSTAMGAFSGQNAYNQQLTDLATRQGAIQGEQQYDLGNLGADQGTLNNIYNQEMGMGNFTNQNLFNGLAASNQGNQANAQNALSVAQANQQAATANHASTNSLFGNVLGAGAALGSVALAPATGGLSLAALGGGVGSSFNPSTSLLSPTTANGYLSPTYAATYGAGLNYGTGSN